MLTTTWLTIKIEQGEKCLRDQNNNFWIICNFFSFTYTYEPLHQKHFSLFVFLLDPLKALEKCIENPTRN